MAKNEEDGSEWFGIAASGKARVGLETGAHVTWHSRQRKPPCEASL